MVIVPHSKGGFVEQNFPSFQSCTTTLFLISQTPTSSFFISWNFQYKVDGNLNKLHCTF